MQTDFIPAPRTFSALSSHAPTATVMAGNFVLPTAAEQQQHQADRGSPQAWEVENAWQEGFDAGAMGSWHNGLLWGAGVGASLGIGIGAMLVKAGYLLNLLG